MKRIFISLTLILGFGLVQANAQGISFGVKAETNMSNFIMTGEWSRRAMPKFGFGASFGGFMKYDVSRNFAIQPELLFHFKNSTLGNFTMVRPEGNFRYSGIEIPIYVLGQWRIGNGRFYAGVGPYAGLGFSAIESYYHIFDSSIYVEWNLFEKNTVLGAESTLRRFDFGLGAMVGYEINKRIQINATYKIGLLNARERAREHAFWRWQTFSLGLGYRF